MTMALTMILNGVSVSHYFLCQIRVAQHAFADAEKSCAGPLCVKQRQHLRCDIWVGSIIDGNRDAGRSALCRQAGPIWAQELASRPESRRRQRRVIGEERAQGPGPEA